MMDLRAMDLHHEGADLVGQFALPLSAGPQPAVLIFPNALGLGPHVRERAAVLADAGYVALAVDMYGDGALYSAAEDAGAAFTSLVDNPRLLRARANAWLDALKARPEVDAGRVAAIGYCFGGLCVLELARSGADAKVVVSYHGTLTTSEPAQPGAVKARVAVYTGGKDPYAPLADVDALRDELTAAGAVFDITLFSEAQHSFTDPDAAAIGWPGIAYDEIADRLSWAGTLALLKAVLG